MNPGSQVDYNDGTEVNIFLTLENAISMTADGIWLVNS